MRSLLLYGSIGAFTHVMVVLVLAAIAAPQYQDYLIARDLQQIMLSNEGGMGVLFTYIPLMFMLGLFAAYLLIWYLVAGRLNPALVRFPMNDHDKPLRIWLTWLLGSVLFLFALMKVGEFSTILSISSATSADFAKWGFVLLAAAVSWLLVSPSGLGRFELRLFERLSVANILRTALLGMGFIVIFALVSQLIGEVTGAWFVVFSEALDRNSEINVPGFIWFGVVMMVSGGIAYAVIFGLLPLFVPGNGKLKERLRQTRPAPGLLVVTTILAVSIVPGLYKIHYLGDNKLTDVTDISEIQPLALAKTTLCLDPTCLYDNNTSAAPVLKVDKYDEDVLGYAGSYLDGGKVPLHPNTVPVLHRFLREHEYSVLRKSAMGNAVEVYNKLWQPMQALRLKQQLVQEGELNNPLIIWSMVELAWLGRAAPVNEDTRRLLARLSDESEYFIGDRAALKLAQAWARFGNGEQADKFLQQAKSARPDKYQRLELTRAGLFTGEISGHIAMPGDVAGIRVGLFRVNLTPAEVAERAREGKPAETRHIKDVNDKTNVTTSTVLSSDGEFHFTNLGSGDYYLALLIPQDKLDGAGKVAGHNIPDGITLNEQNAQRDLGEIRLVPE